MVRTLEPDGLSRRPRGPALGNPYITCCSKPYLRNALRSILSRVKFRHHWKIPEGVDCPQMDESTRVPSRVAESLCAWLLF